MVLLVTAILGFMLGIGHPLPWTIIVVLVAIPYLHNKLIKKHTLVWHSSMSTGIELIDHDHQTLIKLINKFRQATEFNVSDESIEQSLAEVVAYTKYHFAREEKLMALNHYPNFESHQKQHRQMIEKINHYVEEYRLDKANAIDHTLHFLQSWLVQHIKGSDQEYVPYLKVKVLPVNPSRSSAHV
jgi:hemerythrin-like metal-binding domain